MSKDEEIRHIQTRRKNILYLIQRYLNDNGFYGTANTLKAEAKLSDEFELCDNIDLDGMYLEYASYYQLKFGKYPKILRKLSASQQQVNVIAGPKCTRKKHKQPKMLATADKDGRGDEHQAHTPTCDVNELQITVTKMDTQTKSEQSQQQLQQLQQQKNPDHITFSLDADILEMNPPHREQLSRLQDIQHGGNMANNDLLLTTQEWQNLADLIKSCITREDLQLKWSDICGNLKAVEIIKEAVLLPLQYPQLFSNGLKPWRSVLLHGPPGSGKTLMAKILYSETRNKGITFFNITSSIVISKWRGESEKLLKVLFHMAQKLSPSVIFFDEIEGLTSKRDRSVDHESSKRFKNELLQLMDGLEQSSQGIFIMASTNLPWEIDEAFLRRFEKKLMVQLPNEVERAVLIHKLLPLNVKLTEEQMSFLVQLSQNFTGDEIRLACKEIAMQTIRKVTKASLKGEKAKDEMAVEAAFRQIKPLSVTIMEKHVRWQKEHGS